MSQKQPKRVPDLLGYQSLIIDAYQEFKGDYWMGYDRCFRQRAAAVAQVDKWTNIDITLWNLAFASRGATTHCKFCFSTSHDPDNCALMNDAQVPATTPRSWRLPTKHEYSSRRRVLNGTNHLHLTALGLSVYMSIFAI